MRHLSFSLALIALATSAEASCFVDYKAKQDDPLRLHYGVAQIAAPCTLSQASAQLASRLDAAGWTLLNVLSTFDETGLAERRQDAGPYYLRY